MSNSHLFKLYYQTLKTPAGLLSGLMSYIALLLIFVNLRKLFDLDLIIVILFLLILLLHIYIIFTSFIFINNKEIAEMYLRQSLKDIIYRDIVLSDNVINIDVLNPKTEDLKQIYNNNLLHIDFKNINQNKLLQINLHVANLLAEKRYLKRSYDLLLKQSYFNLDSKMKDKYTMIMNDVVHKITLQLLDEKNYSKAYEVISHGLKIIGADSELLILKGNTEVMLNMYQEAKKSFSLARRINKYNKTL